MNVLLKGGPLMWPILACSILAIAIIFERLFHYHRAKINAKDFVQGIRNTLRRGNVIEAIALCDETPGPVAQVVKAAVVNHDRGREEIRETVQDVARNEVAQLERYLPILATIAQVAPLLGFFGTVTGMIKIFQVIQKVQLANPGDLAAGIWQALLTTAGGLAVAIPTYVAYNFLVSRVQHLVLDMENAANDIVGYLTRREDEVAPEQPIVLAEQNKK